jgi:ankyrin repeat protein
VKRGDAAAVRSLLRAGTDANVADADGTSALHWAAQRDDFKAVSLLAGGAVRRR